MSLTLSLAWRNLWRQPRRSGITVLTIALSSALLVFAASLQTGVYASMIEATVSLLAGDAQVQDERYLDRQSLRHTIGDAAALQGQFDASPLVRASSRRSEAFAMASSEQRSLGALVMGVVAEDERLVSRLPATVVKGHYLEKSGDAVLGAALARRLKMKPGDELTLLGSGLDGSFAAGLYRISGILETGAAELDRGLVQISDEDFQTLFTMRGSAHRIVLRLADGTGRNSALAELSGLLPVDAGLALHPWSALMPGVQQSIRADMATSSFIYLVLSVLVAFSITNTQLMSVMERQREFGVQLALGLPPGHLLRLILLESGLLCVIGLATGVLLGVSAVLIVGQIGLPLPGLGSMASQFGIPNIIYPELRLMAVAFGPLCIFSACMIASLYPAGRVLASEPVAAMRAV